MKEKCLICGEPLVSLPSDTKMQCALCHGEFLSKTACERGHYVCDACRSDGLDAVTELCLAEASKNPLAILRRLMALPLCHMHGPEHHVLVGSALLTAFRNAGGSVDLRAALAEMRSRGQNVPGGACGFWGACGAAISTGIFLSIAVGSNPLAVDEWGPCNLLTSACLAAIGNVGGPRCCKRNSYLAIREAVGFVREHLGVQMELGDISCIHSPQNAQCIGSRCPFHAKPKVAFICIHNSCRSQIAEALGRHLAGDRFDFYSAGTETKPRINQDAVRLVKQLYGIDMELTQSSKTYDRIPTPDIVISMGCDVACPYIGRPFDDNWGLPDPTGKDDAEFIRVIEQIADNIRRL